MTSVISVDQTSIRHDFDRGGVAFRYSDGGRHRRIFVPDEAIADMLKARDLSRSQAEGFVRNSGLKIALLVANQPRTDADEDEVLVTLDDQEGPLKRNALAHERASDPK